MELRRIFEREKKGEQGGGAVTMYISQRVVVETGESEGGGLINSMCKVLKSPVP
jgi:hypothetical protein